MESTPATEPPESKATHCTDIMLYESVPRHLNLPIPIAQLLAGEDGVYALPEHARKAHMTKENERIISGADNLKIVLYEPDKEVRFGVTAQNYSQSHPEQRISEDVAMDEDEL